MKKSILLIALLVLTSSIQAQKRIKGNGNVTSITRTTSDYEHIKCAGSFDFVLIAGTEGNIKIEGEENLLEYILTEIKNDQLVIKTKDYIQLNPSGKNTIKITIPFKHIESVALAGSGDLWNDDAITGNSFNSSVAGSGNMVLNLNVSSVKANIAGSGTLTLKGQTNDLEADISGSGDFNGFELQSNQTDISVTGSGNAKVVSNESLKARVTGSGDIKYKGNPKTEDSKVVGSGTISN